MLKKLLFISSILLSSPIFANNYFGIVYSISTFDGEPDISPTSLELKIGKEFSQGFALEGRFSIPLQSESLIFNTSSGIFEIDFETSHTGIVAILGEQNFYAAVGFLDVELEGSLGSVSASASESGSVFGLGYRTAPQGGLFGEYLVGSGDLEDITWFNIGYSNVF